MINFLMCTNVFLCMQSVLVSSFLLLHFVYIMHGLSEMLNVTKFYYNVDYLISSGYSKTLTVDVVQHKCKNTHFESSTIRFKH